MNISSQISWRPPPIDEEGSNIQINDLEEEARALKANGVSIAKTRIKIRVKVPKQQDSHEDKDEDDSNTKVASESSNLIEEDESGEISRSHICPECEKGFPSLKSLYGHLRSHPNRGYRGAKPPSSKRSKRKAEDPVDRMSAWSQTPKRTRSGYYDTREVESAMTLILISRGLQPKKSNAKKSYTCGTCNKSFSTHQALGGHMASHNKHKNGMEFESEEGTPTRAGLENDRDETAKSVAAVHRCEICSKVFGSGQALGGHKRMHYAEIHGGQSVVVVVPLDVVAGGRKEALNDFDLNQPPKFEDEEEI